MSVLPNVQKAVYALIKATLPFGANSAILSTSQANRISWREALDNLASGRNASLGTPWVAVQFGAMLPFTQGAMDAKEFEMQLAIYFVMSMRDVVRTTVSAGANSVTQAVASAANIFVGQLLHFPVGARQVVSIAGLNVTLDSAILTTTDEVVESDVETDCIAHMEVLVSALARGSQTSGMVYRILEDPTLDCSSENLPNRAFLEMQAPLHAGQLTVSLIVGDSGVA